MHTVLRLAAVPWFGLRGKTVVFDKHPAVIHTRSPEQTFQLTTQGLDATSALTGQSRSPAAA